MAFIPPTITTPQPLVPTPFLVATFLLGSLVDKVSGTREAMCTALSQAVNTVGNNLSPLANRVSNITTIFAVSALTQIFTLFDETMACTDSCFPPQMCDAFSCFHPQNPSNCIPKEHSDLYPPLCYNPVQTCNNVATAACSIFNTGKNSWPMSTSEVQNFNNITLNAFSSAAAQLTLPNGTTCSLPSIPTTCRSDFEVCQTSGNHYVYLAMGLLIIATIGIVSACGVIKCRRARQQQPNEGTPLVKM